MSNNLANETKETRMTIRVMLITATIIGAWVTAAMTVALARADWQAGELFRQYLVSIGLIQDFETLVDFYTHIKGIEYIICVAFLGAFPAFFKYLNKEKSQVA